MGKDCWKQRLLQVYEGALTDGDIMAWIARHPLIATAYNNGVSGMDADEFDRFYAQNGTNRVPEGWLAQIDNARISGIPNLNGTSIQLMFTVMTLSETVLQFLTILNLMQQAN